MSINLLVGKCGVIFGVFDDKLIVWKVAECCVEEGVIIILINVFVVLCMGGIQELGKKFNVEVILADVISEVDFEKFFGELQEILGGKIDFVLYVIGMLFNV